MAKRGELKPMDEFEEGIRNAAVAYNVVLFQPGSSSRVRGSFETIDPAKAYGFEMLDQHAKVRSAMIYAIDEHGHHALVGTIARHNMIYKPVEATRY